MRLLEANAPLPGDGRATVVTVGTFDGVHVGHLDVLQRLCGYGAAHGLASLLVTFDQHPLEVLNPAAAPPLLTTREEKLGLLEPSGVDVVAIVPFTAHLAGQSAESFVDEVLRARFRMAALLIGHDHGFGRGREGDADTLATLGELRGFAVEVVAPVLAADGQPVSSTLVRQELAAGNTAEATALLGRPYSVRGTVVHGDARGRTLGVPTLNVSLPSARKLLPADGVYAVQVRTAVGLHDGMLNLGGRPTFGDDRQTLEAHLFDAAGDFYGQEVEVRFVARLRGTIRFSGAEALRVQLAEDERAARRALTAAPVTANLKGSMHFPPSTP